MRAISAACFFVLCLPLYSRLQPGTGFSEPSSGGFPPVSGEYNPEADFNPVFPGSDYDARIVFVKGDCRVKAWDTKFNRVPAAKKLRPGVLPPFSGQQDAVFGNKSIFRQQGKSGR